MHIEFTVYGDPVSLKRHRSTKTGHMYDPSKGDKRDFLGKAIEAKPDAPFDESIRLVVRAFFSRPGGHYGKRKGVRYLKSTKLFHTVAPDADNLLKFVGDSLNGIFWKDDRCISSASVVKMYTESTPRVVVEISPINENPLPFEINQDIDYSENP